MDAIIFRALNIDGGTVVDVLMLVLTRLGEGDFLWVLALMTLRLAQRLTWSLAASLTLAPLLSGAATQILKLAVDRPRPLLALGAEQVRVLGEPLYARSFPSGHSACAFAIALVLVSTLQSTLAQIAVWLLALGIGLSRVYVGAHYPGDVLAGALLGVFLAKIVLSGEPSISRRVEQWRKPKSAAS